MESKSSYSVKLDHGERIRNRDADISISVPVLKGNY